MENSTVTLKTPLKSGEQEITTVTIREPDTGSLRGLDMFSILRMDITQHRTLLPRISNLTSNDFDMLKPSDLVAVQSEVVSFFGE